MTATLAIEVTQDGRRGTATCSWQRADGAWTVRLDGPFGTVVGNGPDAFEALLRAREQVEPAGWRIGVAGARPDVWPSGMARDMGEGLVAYRLTAGQRPAREDLVDVFSAADPDDVVDVPEQRAATAALMGRAR